MSAAALNGDDDCGCAERGSLAAAEASAEPAAASNRPGLSALSYRIGNYASFSARLLTLLEREQPNASSLPRRLLRAPTTRDPSDPALALLDAFAIVADVLSFYQERTANEGFLRTATERGSVIELARSIGYRLTPGLAATTWLSFTVDDAVGQPTEVIVDRGSKVSSIPGQNETPKIYETLAPLRAKVVWNLLRPVATRQQTCSSGATFAMFAGANLQLSAGDALLFVQGTKAGSALSASGVQSCFRVVRSVQVDVPNQRTRVRWSGALTGFDSRAVKVYVFRQRAALFGNNAPDFQLLQAQVRQQLPQQQQQQQQSGAQQQQQSGAQQQQLLAEKKSSDATVTEWPGFELASDLIDLESAYPKAMPNTWLFLVDGSNEQLSVISKVRHLSLAQFGLSSKSTELVVKGGVDKSRFGRRTTTAFFQAEELTLSEVPDTQSVAGATLILDREVPGLVAKQSLVVSGRRAATVASTLELVDDDLQAVALSPGDQVEIRAPKIASSSGVTRWSLTTAAGVEGEALGGSNAIVSSEDTIGEVVEILSVTTRSDGRSELSLSAPLIRAYDRRSFSIYANVVPASHGETVAREVLGGGDGAARLQTFALKKGPLSYAWIDGVVQSSLEVRIDGVAWQEVPSLYGAGPNDQVFEVSVDAAGMATVRFGDGQRGALPRTGVENVIAAYRVGSGLAGAVGAGKLTVMLTRIQGIRSVTNPLAAEGGADAESLDEARQNAPLKVTTLERIVSLQDFEDFVRAQPGVSKAAADDVWSGQTRLVHVTVSTSDTAPLVEGGTFAANLAKAVARAGAFPQQVLLAGHQPRFFRLSVEVVRDPAYALEAFLSTVKATLVSAFGFDRRALSQPVTETEVLSIVQQVAGVIAVNVTALGFVDSTGVDAVAGVLPSAPAGWNPTRGMYAAELLLIDPAKLSVTEASS